MPGLDNTVYINLVQNSGTPGTLTPGTLTPGTLTPGTPRTPAGTPEELLLELRINAP